MGSAILPNNSPSADKLGELIWVNPGEILDSPFGKEVNTPLASKARKALEDSIAEERKVRVPLFCIRNKNGRLQVICGTNRLEIAKLLGLEVVPVIVVEFESMEAAKQFAIKDNLQRRQMSSNDTVCQGYFLWKSFETEKIKGVTPRRRASDASGVGEGTLANFGYVMDSGFQEIIDSMLSGELKVNAAYTKVKAIVHAADAPSTPAPVPVKMERMETDLKTVVGMLKVLDTLAGRITALAKSVGGSGAAQKKALLKKCKKHQDAFRNAKDGGSIDKVLDALETLEIELL